MPFAEAITAATKAVQEEQAQRPTTPFDDPSSDEDKEEYRPKYKDVFCHGLPPSLPNFLLPISYLTPDCFLICLPNLPMDNSHIF